MIAQKLTFGDEIRVIAPSRSLRIVEQSVFDSALKNLTKKGFEITFSKNSRELTALQSSRIQSRVEDLQDAFSDRNVAGILTALGGFSVNQILGHIDYALLAENPKILCGFSDITALLNALYAKTGLVTYHGPHFSSFGFEAHLEYTDRYFNNCLMEPAPYTIAPSVPAERYRILQPGTCTGTILGGNLCTMNLLQGTEFMPAAEDVVLFLEDDNITGEYFPQEFDRNLESLLQAMDLSSLKGLVLGRFDDCSGFDAETAAEIIRNKKQLADIPVLFNADFGHVQPFATFPIGGKAAIDATGERPLIRILEH